MRSWVRVPPSALNLVVFCPTYPCTKLVFPLLPYRCKAKAHFPNMAFIDMDHVHLNYKIRYCVRSCFDLTYRYVTPIQFPGGMNVCTWHVLFWWPGKKAANAD